MKGEGKMVGVSKKKRDVCTYVGEKKGLNMKKMISCKTSFIEVLQSLKISLLCIYHCKRGVGGERRPKERVKTG